MHEDDEQRHGADERDADEVQAHRQPAHGAAEQVVGRLVGVQQLLVPGGADGETEGEREGERGGRTSVRPQPGRPL